MIGIFGGTFDPVHYGHITPALDVMRALSLDELRFIPCSIPAHRDVPFATAEQRLEMLRAAIKGQDNCIVDERELNRKGVSYMVDTLQSLRDEFKNKTLCLIIGMDAFLGLNRWSRWMSIFNYAHCIVTYRPGCELNIETLPADLKALVKQRSIGLDNVENDKDLLEQTDFNKTGGALVFMPVTQLDISATDIRQRIKQNHSIDTLVPAEVNRLIQQQQLYTG